ncbi:hypothetical protein INP83_18180 [Mucilaginibacter sp. 21P]|uniref:hypothetical protein n=1 Tax=Mucilaginibacter sp. 21P TaxID=2778902 RepID=UPI001C59B102|nr:hypothetical protein [Mucilaginibacter sp. 21P]QXV64988.1 hypothetical protein INP83_18180 [Mucilaginibacter sp. 21P]
METILRYGGCWIQTDENTIYGNYDASFGKERWQITLQSETFCYINDNVKTFFNVADVKEIQFEIGDHPRRGSSSLPQPSVYVILKNDPDPKEFFHFIVNEEFVLSNKTRAYDACEKLVSLIGERYGISTSYKLSIDTKKKRNAIALVPLVLIIIVIVLLLRLRQ